MKEPRKLHVLMLIVFVILFVYFYGRVRGIGKERISKFGFRFAEQEKVILVLELPRWNKF